MALTLRVINAASSIELALSLSIQNLKLTIAMLVLVKKALNDASSCWSNVRGVGKIHILIRKGIGLENNFLIRFRNVKNS